jgi:hypothetical protein
MTFIRIANKEDLPKVVELIAEGVGDVKFDGMPDVEMATLADSVYRSWMVAPCFLVCDGDKIVGCASLALKTFPWSQKPSITSNMVYVQETHRSYAIISKLYKAIKGYAKLHGLLYFDTYLGTDRVDARSRILQAQGLVRVGLSMVYDGVST